MPRGASQPTTKSDGNRPPINGNTPAAIKTLGQCLNAMLDTSSWIELFAPKAARQAVGAELVEELSHPVNSTSTSQVAEVMVSLLMAMGMEAHAYPSSTALADWTASEAGTELQRWKRKLKTAFGSKDVGIGRQPVAQSAGERVNPANIPLSRTPKKTTRAVFGSAEQSPYFHDSHMVTPRSESTVETETQDRVWKQGCWYRMTTGGSICRRKSESSEHSVVKDAEEDHPSSVRLSRTVAIFP
ncbi:Eukaryotic/viral aspartic protease [Phytophthora megakarya]|uniref:Eukaryotic/viral aspartic protease n=1 Tax=Phytophthora megakarya TaxID=4795 RepID=A0A225X1N8_9STRA|nr:Eukaryotic/viral aspartic protease [Phytophthora megakarya]